ncbi:MAG TPA: electron transfer flavoprotein subunit alpha/FixB family protein [Solirubrobacteraceae bacterium]|jgi:electron transfer flavoprotein alpha subunit|nr:electron transfer flavoprotein subunit alpha/FixB family protein [Solirubrobacteraceae bacterium]
MRVLVFVEGAGDELSQQAVAFARTVAGGDGELDAISVSGGYAAAAWGQTLADLVAARQPSAVVAPGSDRGNEVLAHAAAILDLPLSTNTTGFAAGDPPTVTRVRWGGSLLEEALLRAPTLLMTVAAHSVAADTGTVEVELVSASGHALAVAPTERVGATSGGVSLEDAKVIVSGGRGVGSSEAFAVIEELAELLGGAVGCSRAVTSAGWRPHSDQVGQTGTKVAPDIYIACGISGATQHMAGCKGAKRLLAINEDGEASIFAHADYGVIGDLHTVIPAIVAELRKVRGA